MLLKFDNTSDMSFLPTELVNLMLCLMKRVPTIASLKIDLDIDPSAVNDVLTTEENLCSPSIVNNRIPANVYSYCSN